MSRAVWIVTIIVAILVVALIAIALNNRNANPYSVKSRASQTASVLAAVEVRMEDFKFSPNPLKIFQGDTVSFINYDSVDHSITSNSFSSGLIRPGQVYTHVFTEKGQFDYRDTFYPTMQGKIIVE
jgi:plastocyanin